VRFIEVKSSVLEEKYTIQILLVLLKSGCTSRMETYKPISQSSSTLAKRVNVLRDIGLIKETSRTAHPFTRMLELTPKGRRVAELLARVEDELQR